jgi:hypothetical protein
VIGTANNLENGSEIFIDSKKAKKRSTEDYGNK